MTNRRNMLGMALVLAAALATVFLVISVLRLSEDVEAPTAEAVAALPTVQPPRPALPEETTQQRRNSPRQGAGTVRTLAAVPDRNMDDDPEALEVRVAFGAPDVDGANGVQEPAGPDDAREDRELPTISYQLLGEYQILGYDLCTECCGKDDGITSSGTAAAVGRTAACTSLPFGTRVYIEGIGERVIEDTGALAANVIDVLCADHAGCFAITGVRAVYRITGPEGTT